MEATNELTRLEAKLSADRGRLAEIEAEQAEMEAERGRLLAQQAYDGGKATGLTKIEKRLAGLQVEAEEIAARLPAGEAMLESLQARSRQERLQAAEAEYSAGLRGYLTAKLATLDAHDALRLAREAEGEVHDQARALADRVRGLGGRADLPTFNGSPARMRIEIEQHLLERSVKSD